MAQRIVIITTLLAVLGCDSGESTPEAAPPPPVNDPAMKEQRRVPVTVTGSGYEPASIEARAGEPLTLVFKRTTEEGCGQQLVFPDHDIRRELPLNQEVEVVLTPKQQENIGFTCGMGMYRGSIVASAK